MPLDTTLDGLPAPEEVRAIDELLGTLRSDFDGIRSGLERAVRGDAVTLEEYRRLRDAGELPPDPPALDTARLPHIVTFATAAIEDAAVIMENARRIQRLALHAWQDAQRPAGAAP